MAKLPRRELVRELTAELENDPDISIRAIGRRVRDRGITVSNDRLRATVRAIRGGAAGGDVALFDRGKFVSERQFTIALRDAIYEHAAANDIEVNPTHMRLVWQATGTVDVYHYGDLLSRETVQANGVAVYAIADYKPELLAARAANELTRLAIHQAGDFPDTLIEGVETEVISSDIRLTDTDLRGSRNRYGTRRT